MRPNEQQQLAIDRTDRPLLVTAGPGTGKTFVIEQKVVHLVRSGKARAHEILCLTFTDKAAGEMSDRTSRALAVDGEHGEVHAATFHAFCNALLTEFAGRAGLPPHFHLLNGAPLEYLLNQNLDRFRIEHTELTDGGIDFVHQLAWTRQRCKHERIGPGQAREVAERAHKQASDEDEQALWGHIVDLARGLAVADEVLAEAGAVTYDDLIEQALRLVENDPIVRRTLADRYRFLLVDEFQDDNYAQAQLVHALAELGLVVTVVGDEDQSIYKFRGAYERTLKDFLKGFEKEADRVDLVQNYRSTQNVLTAAETLIRHAPDRLAKPPLKAVRDDEPEPVVLIEAEYPEDEARAVAAEIDHLHRRHNVALGDMAVLYRAGSSPALGPLRAALTELGIPADLQATGDLFALPEVKDLVSWLLFLRDPSEPGPALHRVLTGPEVALPFVDEPTVSRAVRSSGKRGLDALDDARLEEFLTRRGAHAVRRFQHLASELVERRRSASPAEYVGAVLRRTGLLGRATRETAGGLRTRELNAARGLVQVLQIAREWERSHPLATADDFADYLWFLVRRRADPEEAPEPLVETESVQIMTAHRSKGKEFSAVFVIGANAGQFPIGSRAPRPGEHLVAACKREPPPAGRDEAEERRLLFVAMTRAEDRLFLTRHRRTTPSARGVKRPSPYLAEIGFDPAEDDGTYLKPPSHLERRVVEGEHETEGRPLTMDSSLWLVNRVAAEVSALQRSPVLDDEALAAGLRRVVETAVQAVQDQHPQAARADIVASVAEVLGELDLARADHGAQLAEALEARRTDRVMSYSAFQAYDQCPKRYYYRYFLSVPEPTTRVLQRGLLIHRVLERFHREHDSKGSFDELVALMDAELEQRVAPGHEKAAEDVRQDLVGLLDAYWSGREELPGTVQDVETSLHVELEGFSLVAKIDRVDRLPDGRVELIDYKTGKAKSANHYATKDLQMPLYAMAWKAAHGELPAAASVWGLGDGRLVRLSTDEELSEERLATAAERAGEIVRDIDSGEFAATPGYHCRFCPYEFICEDAA